MVDRDVTLLDYLSYLPTFMEVKGFDVPWKLHLASRRGADMTAFLERRLSGRESGRYSMRMSFRPLLKRLFLGQDSDFVVEAAYSTHITLKERYSDYRGEHDEYPITTIGFACSPSQSVTITQMQGRRFGTRAVARQYLPHDWQQKQYDSLVAIFKANGLEEVAILRAQDIYWYQNPANARTAAEILAIRARMERRYDGFANRNDFSYDDSRRLYVKKL